MKNWLRFSAATAVSMLLIVVGVAVSYMGCDGDANVQTPVWAPIQLGQSESDAYQPAESAVAAESSIVYFTSKITPEGLKAVYDALKQTPKAGAKVAVKLSTGEPPNSNYLRAALIKDFIQSLPSATIVECNTIYGGERGTTASHKKVAEKHGFTAIAPVDIMDENGSMSIPVPGTGTHLKGENYVGKNFANYDYYVVLSHFKGHAMAGLGGAIKNISIGIGSGGTSTPVGKSWIHSAGSAKSGFTAGGQNDFEESMAEAGLAVATHVKNRASGNGNILYINVMNKLSIDCDCFGNPTAVDMADIGILSSMDPVALDQACVDLVKKAKDGKNLVNRMGEKNGYLMISHGAKIGLGSQTYKVIDLDKSTSINTPEREISVAAACNLVRPK
jgi:uncharacterized protein